MFIVLIVFALFIVWGIFTEQIPEGLVNGVMWGLILSVILSVMTMVILHNNGEVVAINFVSEHELLAIENGGSAYYISADDRRIEVVYLDEEHILEYESIHKDNVEIIESDSQKPKLMVYEKRISYNENLWFHIPIFLQKSKIAYKIVAPEGTILHKFNIK